MALVEAILASFRQGVVLAGCLLAIGLGSLQAGTLSSTTITIDLEKPSKWTINPLLFGMFYEEHAGDVTPGIFEQLLVNPSFEPWFSKDGQEQLSLVFEVPSDPGVAFPWQAYPGTPTGRCVPSEDPVNSAKSQRVDVRRGEEAGVLQQVALPDYRTRRYKLRFYAKASGTVNLRVLFLNAAQGTRVLDEKPVSGLAERWNVFQITLELPSALSMRHVSHFGVARLAFAAGGEGSLFLDQATLVPDDAVDGLYNPETLENIVKFSPTAIRWPGGNFTSGYHWREGIGPIDRRPTRPNRAWGGLDANHVGTDEWLRFCERAKLVPVMGVGFGEISAQEAAEWVEYCNGPANSPMGRLRAANGRAEPYHVKYWGIGNEVYGGYQIGHTDAPAYAKGFQNMARAMKSRDPSIEVIAVGLGAHNAARGQRPRWDETVLGIAGKDIDWLDVHYYLQGPEKLQAAGQDVEDVQRAFLGSSSNLQRYYDKLRQLLGSRPETRRIRLAHTEWGALPHAAQEFRLGRQTFLNALVTADQYHLFLRNGDWLQMAMLHNFSYVLNPVRAHAEPPNPRSTISQLYRSFSEGRVLPIRVEGPTYSTKASYGEIARLAGVSEISTLGVIQKDGRRSICLLNRHLTESAPVVLRVTGGGLPESLTMRVYQSADPFRPVTWKSPEPAFQPTQRTVPTRNGQATLELPPHSLTYLQW